TLNFGGVEKSRLQQSSDIRTPPNRAKAQSGDGQLVPGSNSGNVYCLYMNNIPELIAYRCLKCIIQSQKLISASPLKAAGRLLEGERCKMCGSSPPKMSLVQDI
ncbi:hypothetical protein HAX54_010380, partial [Datura stramonium]|nr:hypothetical protein [Datura stramonium]